MKNILKKAGDSTHSLVDVCERVSKIGIYLLIFLVPVLFLPWTANVLEFNKQAALIILTFISFFAWLLKVLISGKAKINLSIVYIPVALVLLVYSLSTIFSWWRYGSFWGWPQITSESLVSIVGLVLVYVLIANIFNRKEMFYLASTLTLSGVLAMIFGIFQLFGKYLFSVGFTKAVSFNTIGGVANLGIFAAVLLPLSMMLLVTSKKNLFRVFFAIAIFVEAITLLVVNVSIVWWLVIVGSALVFAFAMQRRDIFDSRWLIMPMFFLSLALLFSLFRFSIPGMPERPIEVYLKQVPSLQIVAKSLQTNPVFGTGPGTFNYNFARYKETSFNAGNFWNASFDWAGSKFLTVLSTTGVLGGLVLISLIGFFIYFGIIFLLKKSHVENISIGEEEDLDKTFLWNLGIGLFISFIVLSVAYFLYNSNITLDFVYFAVMALFIGLLYPTKKEFTLKSSSFTTLIFTFVTTIIFVFGLGIIILEGQRYVSAVSYLDGVKLWQEGKFDQALKNLSRAATISPAVDLYWREIAQANLQNIDIIANNSNLSQDQKKQTMQASVNQCVNAAKTATEINPKNPINWALRGSIYQSLIGTVGGTKDWSVQAYEEALKLEPANPSYPTQAGVSILKEVGNLSEQEKDKKDALLEEAKKYFEEAITLKSDYAVAHFQLARIYMDQKKDDEMVNSLEKAKESAPYDVGLAFQLGLIYYQKGDFEKARIELERAVFLSPNYANALYFLGLTYDKLKQRDMAIIIFQKIIESNPDNSLVITILSNLKAGKSALDGVQQENAAQPPINEK
jgi:tetratricopeptide (TPR) repeat protein